MKMFKKVALAGALVAGSVVSLQASALVVDFTDAVKWGNPSPSTASYFATSADYTYPGSFEVTVTAPKKGTRVAWEQQDGFGVQGLGDSASWDDDIENFNGAAIIETLKVAFSTPADVSRVRLADFHGTAQYNVGGGWAAIGPGTGANGPGDWFAVMGSGANNIRFRALGGDGNSFQVSGLDVAPVPLPPAVWLLGSAMAFLLRKRQVS